MDELYTEIYTLIKQETLVAACPLSDKNQSMEQNCSITPQMFPGLKIGPVPLNSETAADNSQTNGTNGF